MVSKAFRDGNDLDCGHGIEVLVKTHHTTRDWDSPVSSVARYVNNALFTTAAPSGNTFSFTWTGGSNTGYYTFVAVATDNHGLTNASTPVTITVYNTLPSPNLPNAAISNLVETVTTYLGIESIVYPVIRDGLFSLIGDASDADPGDALAYQVLLY